MNRIKNGPSTRVATSRGWRTISKISFRKKEEDRMMPRKKLPMAHRRAHEFDKDVFKWRHILLHRLYLDVLPLCPSHELGGVAVGLVYDDTHAVRAGTDRLGTHKRQGAQYGLGLEIEWLGS